MRLLGYGSAEQLVGTNMHVLMHHTRADGSPCPIEECRVFESVQRGRGIHIDNEVFWRADGTRFPVEYWAYPIQRNGRVVGSVVTFLDITERKHTEAEREKLIANLEQQNAELERFFYTVSHDLKTPLITLKGFMGVLREDLAASDTQAVEDDVARMSNAATKMSELLEDLLELSRIGRVVNPSENVSIEELAHEATEPAEPGSPSERSAR